MAIKKINPRFRVILALLAVLTGIAVFSAYAATSDWIWITTAPLTSPTNRSYHNAVSVDLAGGGKGVMLVGGLGDLFSPITSSQIFSANLGGRLWAPAPSLAVVHMLPAVTLLANGKVLVAGGYQPDKSGLSDSIKTCEILDPQQDQGQGVPTGDLNEARDYHTATLLSNDPQNPNYGKVLVAGGQIAQGGDMLRSYEIYGPDPQDPTKPWKWTYPTAENPSDPSKRLPFACAQQTATLLQDGTVLLVAVMMDFTGPVPISQIYVPDPEGAGGPGDYWTYDYLNYARQGHTATLLEKADGRVLVVGGGPTKCEVYQPLPALLPSGVSPPPKKRLLGN